MGGVAHEDKKQTNKQTTSSTIWHQIQFSDSLRKSRWKKKRYFEWFIHIYVINLAIIHEQENKKTNFLIFSVEPLLTKSNY